MKKFKKYFFREIDLFDFTSFFIGYQHQSGLDHRQQCSLRY